MPDLNQAPPPAPVVEEVIARPESASLVHSSPGRVTQSDPLYSNQPQQTNGRRSLLDIDWDQPLSNGNDSLEDQLRQARPPFLN